MDADSRPHVPVLFKGQHPHVGAPSRLPFPTQVLEFVAIQPRLVVVGQHHHLGVHTSHHLGQRRRHLPFAVEHAGRFITHFGPLARHPVVLGGIPCHEGLPHVVIRRVAVSVVGRVQIGEVERPQRAVTNQFDRIAMKSRARTQEQLGGPQLQVPISPGGPCLEVRHLLAGRRVHPVGGLDEAGQQDRIQRRGREILFQGIADGIDPGAVLRTEEPGPTTEDLGDVPLLSRKSVEMGQCVGQVVSVNLTGVDGHVALGKEVRIPRRVDRCDRQPPLLEGLGHPGGAGEQVERGGRPRRHTQGVEYRDEPSLGSQVLDHDRIPSRFPPRSVAVRWIHTRGCSSVG